jgi:hypothetical protein
MRWSLSYRVDPRVALAAREVARARRLPHRLAALLPLAAAGATPAEVAAARGASTTRAADRMRELVAACGASSWEGVGLLVARRALALGGGLHAR